MFLYGSCLFYARPADYRMQLWLVWLTGTNCIASSEGNDAYRPANSLPHVTRVHCVRTVTVHFIAQTSSDSLFFITFLLLRFNIVRARRGSYIVCSAHSLSSRNCSHSEFWVTLLPTYLSIYLLLLLLKYIGYVPFTCPNSCN
jgi:hypothetical protein